MRNHTTEFPQKTWKTSHTSRKTRQATRKIVASKGLKQH